MNSFEEGYAQATENLGGIIGTMDSSHYMNNVQSSIDEAIHALKTEAEHRANVSNDYLKGWLAEQWHAETLKVSAAARGRNDIWATVSGKNIPGNDIHFGDSNRSFVAESKYYKTGEETAKALSKPEYSESQKIVPSDQLDSVTKYAERLAHKNETSRPEQAKHYDHTANHSKDHIEIDNVKSKPLEENQAKEMAKDFRKEGDIDANKYELNTESFIEWSDIVREASQAALHAAAISAAISAAPQIFSTIKEYIDSGEIDLDNLKRKSYLIFSSAKTAGIRGGVAAGLTMACKSGLMGESLKSISPSAIGMATTIALNTISYSLQLQQGYISAQQFAHHCIRDSFTLIGGMGGATIGQLIIPIPLLGALAGNLVGSTLGALVFEGMNQTLLGICIRSGWTFFNIVKQDYTVSEEILLNSGYNIFSSYSFPRGTFSSGTVNASSFNTSSLSFSQVTRGIISCNTVGFVNCY